MAAMTILRYGEPLAEGRRPKLLVSAGWLERNTAYRIDPLLARTVTAVTDWPDRTQPVRRSGWL